MSDLVKFVRVFPKNHYNKMLLWLNLNAMAMMDNDAPRTIDEVREHIERGVENGTKWFVFINGDKNDEPIGAAWFDPVGDRVFNGHLVFDKDVQDKGQMTRVAVNIMFHENARKIQWMAYPDNKTYMNFLLRRVGAVAEGCLRGLTPRGDQYVDTYILGTFPEDLLYAEEQTSVFAV